MSTVKPLEHSIEGKPDFAFLTVKLPAGEMIKVEASAMQAMDRHIKMRTRLKGGFKRLISGENLFLNEFTAEGKDGEIVIGSAVPGDIKRLYLTKGGPSLFLQSSSFLASSSGIETTTKFQGFIKGFFSGAGFFLIKCSGEGDIFFNSYGGIIEVQINDEFTIDNNHIVAFTEGLEYSVHKFGGYKSFFFSGEGLITRFRGQGRVWIQTRAMPSLIAWLNPFRQVVTKTKRN
ncbi:MAG: TIGR00266 family protein [Alphaproteobacteria bacterium]|nr:TIGR00266 family protein [Alphaproteobacteria bacterium]MCS5596623.1 TIGR00266 family protein [Alphaproteobacteria bacterium]|tara:strand:- start:9150 stop:9845 length:696 start_codon:yes stop_codon:yes gene_type:complete